MLWESIVIVIAAILLLEGMLILTLPEKTKQVIKKIIKKENQFKFIGMIEALIGLILLIFVLIYN